MISLVNKKNHNQMKKSLTLMLFMSFVFSSAVFGQRYWVATSGNWSGDNWSSCSGCPTDGGGPPLVNETAIFDANSGTCNIDVNVLVDEVDMLYVQTGFNDIITFNSGVSFNCVSVLIEDGLIRGPGSGSPAVINTGNFMITNGGGTTSPLLQLRRMNISTSGNVTVDDASLLNAGTFSTWTLTGNSTTINCPSGLSLRNLTVSKAASGNNTLNGTVSVTGTLTLTSGNLVIGNNNLFTGTISGGSINSFIVTNGTGAVFQNYVGGVGASTPIGSNSSTYLVVTLTPSTSGSHGLNASTNASANALGDEITIVGASNYQLSVEFDLSVWSGTFDASHTSLFSGTMPIQVMNVTGGGPYTAATTSTISGGKYGIGNDIPVPVELISFTAFLINKETVQLDWATGSEKNSQNFSVYKSIDGVNYEKILEREGAGNTSTMTLYQATDKLSTEKAYYKLYQQDWDGANHLLATVETSRLTDNNLDIKQIGEKLLINADDNQIASVVSLSGITVKKIPLNKGENVISLSNLPEGTYIVTTGKHSEKIIIH